MKNIEEIIEQSWGEYDYKDRKALAKHWTLTKEQAKTVVENLPDNETLSPLPHMIQDALSESFLRTLANNELEELVETAKIVHEAYQKDFNRWYE